MQGCQACEVEKETLEHFIIECDRYSGQRQELDRQVTRIIGRQEWEDRKEEEDRGLRTVLGLTDDRDKHVLVAHMKSFLLNSWKVRNN